MPVPLYTPRVNNNDDSVRLTAFLVTPGTSVKQGDPVADVETDKATFTVEADQDGYLLAFCFETGETVAVGSVLAWIGATATEAVPVAAPAPTAAPTGATTGTPTLKAAILLSQYGLQARDVPASGERLSAADIETYVSARGLTPTARSLPSAPVAVPQSPPEPGKQIHLSPPARGMLRTVSWQKSDAVPGYLEISWDAKPWTEYAAAFQKNRRLMLSPLLSLLAWKLTRAVAARPLANSTIFADQSWQYDHVNLGFTVQVGANLVVVVIREAEKLDQAAFVSRLTSLQRGAMRNSLRPEETSGATIGFSSMARWPVTRHVPVLLPHTAIMLAHTAATAQNACLGATYDHRVLNGEDVVDILRTVTLPPAPDSAPDGA
jgi:pyruvate/2-oxoglutarate dehydrogenase complex dihydrolipoamide acyltransferase (E2) component